MVDIIFSKKRQLKRETYSAAASVEMLEGGVSPLMVDNNCIIIVIVVNYRH